MISAPSEMRCRSMLATSITANTIASVSGIASATTVPGRMPRLTKLQARTITIACQSEVRNSLIAVSTVTAWSATSVGSMPTGRLALMSAISLADVLAQGQDVAGIPHGDGETDRRLSVDAEHGLRRVDVAAAHGGDVAQPEDAPADDDVDRLDVGRGIECAGDAQEDALPFALDRARRAHDVLRLQRGEDRAHVEAKSRQALGRKFQVDLLVLRAEHLDLRDVRHVQQPRADRFHVVAQFAEAEAVGGEGVDDAERAAEVVVEERSHDALRQRAADVADVLAHLVPDVRHLRGRRGLLQVDEDRRLAGDGVAAHPIEKVGLLQLALEPLGHLLHGLVDRGTGPGRGDHHRAKRERRIFAAARLLKDDTPAITARPGQAAATTIVRNVNAGSSPRPRLKNEDAHANTPRIIRKTTSERLRSAHSDRFGPITAAASRAGGLSVRTQRLDAGGDHDVTRFRPDATCTVDGFEPAR